MPSKEIAVKQRSENTASSKMMMASLALAMLMPALGVSITNIALPTLANVFDVSEGLVNWIVIGYLLSVTSLILGAGALGDSMGKKRLLLFGISVFSIASLFCAFSNDVRMLVAFRMLQGVGAAFILSQSLAIAGSYTAKQNTGVAMGLIGTTAATGTALGPVVGGLILQFLSWPFIFWLLLLLSTGSYGLSKLYVPDDCNEALLPERFDLLGTALLGVSCALYAISMTSKHSLISVENGAILLFAIFFFGLFLSSQKKASSPLISPSVFACPVRNTTMATHIAVDAIAMSTLVVGPFYLTYALNLSPITVGILMTIGPAVAAFSGYPAGKLVDHFDIKTVMMLGLLLLTLGATCFAVLPAHFGVLGYVVSLLVLTPGRQLFHASNHTFVMVSVPTECKGAASGLLNLCKNLGLMTGASMMSGIFLLSLGTSSVSLATNQQLNSAFSQTFIFAAIVIALLFGCVFIASRKMELLK